MLIVDDPDVPKEIRVHWVLFNLPPETKKLPENLSNQPVLPKGSKQGLNDFQQIGYSGPSPAQKTQRYYFKLYALDRPLDLPEGTTKASIEATMIPYILAVGAR